MDRRTKQSHEELLDDGILAINQAYAEGRIPFQEWKHLTHAWAVRVLASRQGMKTALARPA